MRLRLTERDGGLLQDEKRKNGLKKEEDIGREPRIPVGSIYWK